MIRIVFKTRPLMILLAALLTACPNVTPPPPTPLGLTAATTSSAGIQLSWIASQGASSYTLERRTDGTAFASVGGSITTTTYADGGLQPTTRYTYRVRAVGEGGSSNPSGEASATTPNDLLNLQPAALSSTAINLSWTAVSGASGYTLERKVATGVYANIASPTATNYADSGLTANTVYTYRVTALQSGSSVADEASAATLPSNPSNITASFPGTGVKLDWTAPTEPGTYSYSLERKQGAGAYSSLSSASATSYTDANATAGATYTYRIKTLSNGVSSSGTEKDVTVALNTPTGFSTSALTTKKVVLNWNTVSGANSYVLTRKVNNNAFAALTSVSGTTYTDSTLSPSNSYTYRLQAVSGGGATSATVDSSAVDTTPLAAIKVLFIGNSLTFVNSVPQMIQTLASDELHPFQFEMVVKSGASLNYHYNNTTDPVPTARNKISSGPTGGGKWDFIVLQEFTTNPVCDVNSFSNYVSSFAGDVQAYNTTNTASAKIVLHQNWVVTDSTYISQNCAPVSLYSTPLPTIVSSTNARADAASAKIAPVGQAWGNTSGITLQQSDGIHATPEGSYLAAATYYALLYSKSPVGLTNQVKANSAGVIDPNPNLLNNYTVNSSTANTLQTKAWETVQLDARYRLP